MPHLAIVTGEYPPQVGGVGDYTARLSTALQQEDWQVSVLVWQTPPSAPAPDAVYVGTGWHALRQTRRWLMTHQPAVLHIQYQTGAYGMHPAIMLLPSRLRRWRARPRIVVTPHDLRLPYLFAKADRLRTWLAARLLDYADKVVVTNAADHARLRGDAHADRDHYTPRHLIPTPIAMIPIGINVEPAPPDGYDSTAWRATIGATPETCVIAFFGLVSRTKGVDLLVRALAALPARFRVVLVGGAVPQPDDQRYATEITNLVAQLGVTDRITVTGPCSPAEVSAWLLAADLAVQPFTDGASYRRGSLLTLLAHGLPVITTTPRYPLSPALEDGTHALLVAPEVAAIQSAIERLADDGALRTQLADAGRSLAAQFTWPAIAAAHRSLYDTLRRDDPVPPQW